MSHIQNQLIIIPQIRRASDNKLYLITGAYEHARAFMQANGNATQWPDGYPGRIGAEEDIAHRHCFLVTDEAGPLAVFSFAPGPARPTRRSMVRGLPMPTTTSSTAWPQCVGVGSRGRFSALRLSTRTTYAATPTRTTRRCDARSNPLDSASAAPSRWPTERSASPTTGSKNH